MSMDNSQQMKPQETVIYLLGQLDGKMALEGGKGAGFVRPRQTAKEH